MRRGEEGRLVDAMFAGASLSAAGAIFLIVNNIAETTYPGYSVHTNVLSDLGAAGAPTMVLWDTQLFVSGILTFFGVYFFLRQSGNRNRGVAAVYLLAPLGTVLVSLFPENVNLTFHSIGALLSFLFGGIAAIYTYRLTLHPFRYLSLGLGVLTLCSLVAFLSKHYLGLGQGGMERMIVYPLMVWQLGLGSYLAGMGSARQGSGGAREAKIETRAPPTRTIKLDRGHDQVAPRVAATGLARDAIAVRPQAHGSRDRWRPDFSSRS